MYSAGDQSPYIYLKYLWPGNEASDRRSVPLTKTHDRSQGTGSIADSEIASLNSLFVPRKGTGTRVSQLW